MEDNEGIVQETPVNPSATTKGLKEKKPRTEAQIRATERMLEKRRELDAIKVGHREALKTEKALKLQEKVNKIKEVETKLQQYKSESEEEVEEIVKRKPKPKKKTKIVYEEESSSEEEIVVVKPKKKKHIVKQKQRIVYESESEEEQSLPRQVYKSSNDQLKHDLQTERIHTALRSLGYLA